MNSTRLGRVVCVSLLAVFPVACPPALQAQGAKVRPHESRQAEADHEKERDEWFLRGRVVPGKSAADLRHRAYQAKMQTRVALVLAERAARPNRNSQSSANWVPLGPVPLASDATGDGFQNYNQVSGRATAVAIDPADPSGNTVYIGGAQGGVWKSTNAANLTPNNVTWATLTDDQATLSIGAIAIQPGNANPANSVILAGTGEADNSADSYFGLGILNSTDAGNSWTLVSTANSGTLSFAGLGATRMAFSTTSTNIVVAAMAATNEGVVDGALNPGTYPGLYTSTDAGQTWNYDALSAGGAAEATSATSVVYNSAAGLFFAAVRYRGFFSSPDGLTWMRLSNQPGVSGLLSTTACPQNYIITCPIYRGEITVVPGRNEMYVWFVSADSNGNPVDQGIWLSTNGGVSWSAIDDSGIISCGDFDGCGVEQGFYNLGLAAVPNGTATDLYAGAINLYKCSITAINPSCTAAGFINLTHAYGCDPLAAPAHVHPDQHALAFTLPSTGIDSGADLMYFANDGGIYRALNGFTGLSTGSCSGANQFDDLNQNLGSMTQFVAFSESANNSNTILGGTQDNGSPATASSTTSTSWANVLSGDGGYNAIDPNTGNFFASNPDTGFGNLVIQECSSGVNCNDSLFNVVISSGDVGGDDGAFYFPYILDPQSAAAVLVGTCRVWSGPRTGGQFTLLSLNFDTLGTGTCAGTEINTVRSVAAGGPANANGSQVIYATTDGPGPNNQTAPVGGNVWVTTNAMAVSGASSTFANVTLNGPGGASINPSQFPVSDVAIDASDPTGNTAYVTVMGFTGGPGHVWQTINAGASWADFTGSAPNNLPDSPTNAVVVDQTAHVVYVGTDVGVFQSSTSAPVWSEVGPNSTTTGASGFLPDVAVTALSIFNSGGQKLLRASTYGRGVWQFDLNATPDFEIAISNTPFTAFVGSTATLDGTLTALNGYNYSVTLTCTSGATSPPSPCTPNPATLTPTNTGAPFQVAAGPSSVADYFFNVQGIGSDSSSTTYSAPVTLHVVNLQILNVSPTIIIEPRGSTSPPVSFQVSVQGTFTESVTMGCAFSPSIPGASCAFTPSATVNPTSSSPVNMAVTVTVPATTFIGDYTVTLQATTADGLAPNTASFTMDVVINPTFVLSESNPFPNVKAGSTGTNGPITISSQDGFNSTVSLSCLSNYGPNSCSITPPSVSIFPATATLTINGTGFSAGSYQVTVQGVSGSITNTLPVPFNIGDYVIGGPSSMVTTPGGQLSANLTLTALDSYVGQVSPSCNAAALPGAQCNVTPQGSLNVSGSTPVPIGVNITTPANATPGTYNIILNTQDTSGAPAHQFTIALTVQDFTFGTPAPTTQTVGAGEFVQYNLSVKPAGTSFSGAVSLSCPNAPTTLTCSFAPNPVTPGSGSTPVLMTVTARAGITAGSYNLVVTGTSGSLSHSATVNVTVANILQLSVTKHLPANVTAGSQESATLSLSANFTGSVQASCNTSSLAGTQCSISPSTQIAVKGSPVALGISINIVNNAQPGDYNITVTVQDITGSPSRSVTLPFTVVQDYAIGGFAETSQTISVGQSITYNLSVNPVGAAYGGKVKLNCAVAPAFAGSCTFSPNPVGPLSNATAVAVVMTIATQNSSAQLAPDKRKTGLWFLALIGIPAIVISSGLRNTRTRGFFCLLLIALSLVLVSCGSGSNGGNDPGNPLGGTQPGTYTITVTGTPPSLSQPAGSSVTLVVQ